jgi:TfoX/Sxy family transcriptional regulator of competence genes
MIHFTKVDDSNRPASRNGGWVPFMPTDPRARSCVHYEVPVDLLEDPEMLSSWAEQAIEVARNKRTRKRQR